MRSTRSLRCLFVVIAAALATTAAARAAALRSTMRNVDAVMSYDGFFLNPIGTEPQGEGDLAPPQLFEIVRPGNQAITLGRLYTSCVCVSLEAEKTSFAAGEQAVDRLRNVRLSPPQGQLYAVYVQLNGPVRTVLRFDTFMRSTEFLPSAEGAPPRRGDIVADGVMPEAAAGTALTDADIEVIVPKADNHIPDTSEYTLRKKAEAEAAAKAGEEKAEGEPAEKAPETAGKPEAK